MSYQWSNNKILDGLEAFGDKNELFFNAGSSEEKLNALSNKNRSVLEHNLAFNLMEKYWSLKLIEAFFPNSPLYDMGAGCGFLRYVFTHFKEELEHHILPTFNASAKQSEATLKTLLELETALGGELWIQHDPVQHQKRKMAPDFYR